MVQLWLHNKTTKKPGLVITDKHRVTLDELLWRSQLRLKTETHATVKSNIL